MATIIQSGRRGFVDACYFAPGINQYYVSVRPWGYQNRESVDRESELYTFLDAAEWDVGQNVVFDIIAGNYASMAANVVKVSGF